jgi:acyl-CoA thioesterase-1
MTREYCRACISIGLILLLAAAGHGQTAQKSPLAPIEDVPNLPRVLLIGDSISIGYTLTVRDELQGVANVHRPRQNCQGTIFGLEQLDAWLGSGRWDLIHFWS